MSAAMHPAYKPKMQETYNIDVWHWPLTLADDDERLHYTSLLSPDEVQRANKLLSTAHRDEFIAARAGLRCIIADTLQTDAATLVFSYGPHGKPILETDATEPEVHFNLAHSGGVAAVALSRDNEIGIDIQQHGDTDIRVAKRFFTDQEWQRISNADEQEQRQLFYRCWVLKEAVVKATGDGIQRGLDTFEVSLDNMPARILRIDGSDSTAGDWRLHTFNLAPDLPGAIAVPAGGGVLNVTMQSWSLARS